MKRIAWLTALFVPVAVLAAMPFNPEFSWTAPTQYVSGAALDPDTDLHPTDAWNFYCDGDLAPRITLPRSDRAWVTQVGDFAVGSHSCYVTATDTEGDESAPSGTVNFTVEADAPVPPVLSLG